MISSFSTVTSARSSAVVVTPSLASIEDPGVLSYRGELEIRLEDRFMSCLARLERRSDCFAPRSLILHVSCPPIFDSFNLFQEIRKPSRSWRAVVTLVWKVASSDCFVVLICCSS